MGLNKTDRQESGESLDYGLRSSYRRNCDVDCRHSFHATARHAHGRDDFAASELDRRSTNPFRNLSRNVPINVHDRRRAGSWHVASGRARIFVFSVYAHDADGYWVRFRKNSDAVLPRGEYHTTKDEWS